MLRMKSGSAKKLRVKISRFKQYEWMQIASLLEKNYSLKEALLFLQIPITEERVDLQILQNYTSKSMYHYLYYFAQVCELHKSIHLTLTIMHLKESLYKEFIKKVSYPIAIILFSLVSVNIFVIYIIPQLLNTFSEISTNTLITSVFVAQFVFNLLLITIMLFILISFIVLLRSKYNADLYLRITCRSKLLKQVNAYRFTTYYALLASIGFSSKDAILSICKVSNKTCIAHVVRNLQSKLQNGEDMLLYIQKSNYFCETFKQYFIVGSHNQYLEQNLNMYLEHQKQQWFSMLGKIALFANITSYTLVALLVLSVYQIMLMPLEMLNTL